MQEKTQKISPIKSRILQFADTLGISKREFYKKIGVSRGTLESGTGITEDIMAKFIATFEEVSSDWLLTGRGEMLRNDTVLTPHTHTDTAQSTDSQRKNTKNNCNSQDSHAETIDKNVTCLITILKDTLAEKDKQIETLLGIINKLSTNQN